MAAKQLIFHEAARDEIRCGVDIERALGEALRCIVGNAGLEASVVLAKVDESPDKAFGYDAAIRAYGDLLQIAVIDPAKVTRLALQNAGSIASMVLSVDCLIANAPKPKRAPGEGAMPGAESAEF